MSARVLVAAFVMTLFAPSPAEARRGGGAAAVVSTGDDLIHIRDLDAKTQELLGVDAIGYRYERFGVFWLDLWRWDGEFVVYKDNGYVPLDDEMLATLGDASVPWKYHFPPGLLLILAAIEFAIMIKSRRRAGGVLAIGAGLVVFSIVLLIGGVDKAFAIPLLLGGYHIFVALPVVRAARAEAAATAAAPEAIPTPRESGRTATPSGARARVSTPRMTSQSGTQRAVSQSGSQPIQPIRGASPSGPHAAAKPEPSEAPPVVPGPARSVAEPARPSQPLAIARPHTVPAEAPTKHDDNAAAPKFLR